MQTVSKFKKIMAIVAAGLACLLISIAPLRAYAASTAEEYLALIEQHTKATLAKVDTLPTILQSLSDLALSWLSPDESDSTAALQANFANMGSSMTTELAKQKDMQASLQKDLLGPNATKTTLPNANDLVYSTLLGSPFFTPDPRDKAGKPATANPPLGYFKNVAGLNIGHEMPGSWSGRGEDQVKYYNYYTTITAIQSYDAFILSKLYTDFQNGGAFSKEQTKLIEQATKSDWFAQIAAEKLGAVFRQLLMYQSQVYVLMTQMLETQKQALTAQAMTNTLLVLVNLQNEQLLLRNAKTPPPI